MHQIQLLCIFKGVHTLKFCRGSLVSQFASTLNSVSEFPKKVKSKKKVRKKKRENLRESFCSKLFIVKLFAMESQPEK